MEDKFCEIVDKLLDYQESTCGYGDDETFLYEARDLARRYDFKKIVEKLTFDDDIFPTADDYKEYKKREMEETLDKNREQFVKRYIKRSEIPNKNVEQRIKIFKELVKLFEIGKYKNTILSPVHRKSWGKWNFDIFFKLLDEKNNWEVNIDEFVKDCLTNENKILSLVYSEEELKNLEKLAIN